MEVRHKKLIRKWTDESLLQDLEGALENQPLLPRLGWGFKAGLYPVLRDLDSRIPGVGMHFAIWKGSTPHLPFPGRVFDGVIRPLRYVPYYLASPADTQMLARFIVDCSGAHVEQCVKTIRWAGRKPLGNLVRQHKVRRRLGEDLAMAIEDYGPSWNEAKHEYGTGTPDSVVPIGDAIGNYFTARILGSKVLEAVGKLQSVVDAAHGATQLYHTGNLMEPPDGWTPGQT